MTFNINCGIIDIIRYYARWLFAVGHFLCHFLFCGVEVRMVVSDADRAAQAAR